MFQSVFIKIKAEKEKMDAVLNALVKDAKDASDPAAVVANEFQTSVDARLEATSMSYTMFNNKLVSFICIFQILVI